MSQLTLRDVHKTYGEHTVLDRVSFTVRTGEKVGVIGENGAGKSTLLRLIAGAEQPDNGDLTIVAEGVGHLAQTLDLPDDSTVQDAIDHALSELRDLEARMIAAAEREDMDAYADLYTAFETRGGYEADARVESAMYGLGLSGITRDRTLGTLSGGEQSRLALACVLAAAPELLLLDEPTNHLDQQAVTWLENHLRAHRGTVIAVTHDRAFLGGFATTILEVDLGAVTRYGDGWDGYLTAKAAARRRWEQDYTDWLAEIDRQSRLAEGGIERLSAGERSGERPRTSGHRRSHEAGLSGVVRNARERLRRLEENPVPKPPDPLRFTTRLEGGKGDGLTATLEEVTVGDRLRIDDFRLAPGERLLITGRNGAGKTTMLRVLAGDLRQDSGKVKRPRRTGYLRQEVSVVPPRHTLLGAFADGLPGPADEHAETLLSLGLFTADDLLKPAASLSVGQRRRLELARLVHRPADLLILDEPTNHLSLALIEDLEEALGAFLGALVVVSHDRSFRDRFVGRRLELRDGELVGAAG
ncbi:ATP-binding cassette domain-containing protein [Nonomuraea sp. NBC_01738]|uniref:ribosomal protection-like ABC-F family protein n=1 Tax=Nonomuraea sp. NBC_01738 TaxID=2976003 RepID=UPI002E155A1A|nr:ATP-binding cassette domain-containing protein [Nonomuraea sp. NBC_01738]